MKPATLIALWRSFRSSYCGTVTISQFRYDDLGDVAGKCLAEAKDVRVRFLQYYNLLINLQVFVQQHPEICGIMVLVSDM